MRVCPDSSSSEGGGITPMSFFGQLRVVLARQREDGGAPGEEGEADDQRAEAGEEAELREAAELGDQQHEEAAGGDDGGDERRAARR